MSFFTVFLLAVALSMDAFAVALASGCAIREIRLRQYVRVSAAFGFFQFFMPVLGWFLGQSVHHFIEAWDHWLAFVLLAWIGGNMLRSGIGGLRKAEPVACPRSDPTAGWNLLLLAVATSIDALAVGVSFAFLQVEHFGYSKNSTLMNSPFSNSNKYATAYVRWAQADKPRTQRKPALDRIINPRQTTGPAYGKYATRPNQKTPLVRRKRRQ